PTPDPHSFPTRRSSDLGTYVWKRLRIIASEDIGLADPSVCVQVRALYDNWVEQRKKAKEDHSVAERLFLVHAILICVRARKSRIDRKSTRLNSSHGSSS